MTHSRLDRRRFSAAPLSRHTFGHRLWDGMASASGHVAGRFGTYKQGDPKIGTIVGHNFCTP